MSNTLSLAAPRPANSCLVLARAVIGPRSGPLEPHLNKSIAQPSNPSIVRTISTPTARSYCCSAIQSFHCPLILSPTCTSRSFVLRALLFAKLFHVPFCHETSSENCSYNPLEEHRNSILIVLTTQKLQQKVYNIGSHHGSNQIPCSQHSRSSKTCKSHAGVGIHGNPLGLLLYCRN